MREDDRACGLILLGMAIAACLGASRHEVGTLNNPGPGLFPMVLGVVLGVLSLIILVGGIMARRAAVQGAETDRDSVFSKEAVYVVLALIGYGLLLVPLGFMVTTFAVFAALLRFVTDQKWPLALGGSAVLALGAYVLFDTFLGVPLPRGILGI